VRSKKKVNGRVSIATGATTEKIKSEQKAAMAAKGKRVVGT